MHKPSDADIIQMYRNHPIIAELEAQLRQDGTIDRAGAISRLQRWLASDDLTEREHRALILRFP